MSREIMQQALDALKYHQEQTRPIYQTGVVIELLEAELARKQTPDELLRQSEREGWRYSKELEHEIKRLEAELAKPEQPQSMDEWRSMVVVNLLRRCPNLSKHELRELAAHFQSRLPIAQPEQEPVAWITRRTGDGGVVLSGYETCDPTDYDATPVYNAPPNVSTDQQNVNTSEERVHKSDKNVHEPVSNRIWMTREDLEKIYKQPDVTLTNEGKTWQGLTDDEMLVELKNTDASTVRLPPGFKYFARAIEAKLREKNDL